MMTSKNVYVNYLLTDVARVCRTDFVLKFQKLTATTDRFLYQIHQMALCLDATVVVYNSLRPIHAHRNRFTGHTHAHIHVANRNTAMTQNESLGRIACIVNSNMLVLSAYYITHSD